MSVAVVVGALVPMVVLVIANGIASRMLVALGAGAAHGVTAVSAGLAAIGVSLAELMSSLADDSTADLADLPMLGGAGGILAFDNMGGGLRQGLRRDGGLGGTGSVLEYLAADRAGVILVITGLKAGALAAVLVRV